MLCYLLVREIDAFVPIAFVNYYDTAYIFFFFPNPSDFIIIGLIAKHFNPTVEAFDFF